MNFGHSSKIHLLTPEMFRKKINITLGKARERSPKMPVPIEPVPGGAVPKGATDWTLYCSLVLALHLKLYF